MVAKVMTSRLYIAEEAEVVENDMYQGEGLAYISNRKVMVKLDPEDGVWYELGWDYKANQQRKRRSLDW